MGMHTNRLINEKSPYLLQHAHNPVDWYPWGEEAFQKARGERKPIFLSVGYSSCHWCHVMEQESFLHEDIAALLNRHFVPVKVDREERPDVDRLYMTYVQAVTGSGGWPMSVFLTPTGEPFFGGTYFPPEERYGHPGFRSVIEKIAQLWESDPAQVQAVAEAALEQLRGYLEPPPRGSLAVEQALNSGFNTFRRVFDSVNGGFGRAPKFPRPVVLTFLLGYHVRTGNREALEMVLTTLDAMARGGLHDHLGGGFHRYAVDEAWRWPHFEKMLYDQAQLAMVYLEAWRVSGEARYAALSRETLDYVLREMRHPEGAFYTAQDADSPPDDNQPVHRHEGAYYLWTAAEIGALLEPRLAEWFCRRYAVEGEQPTVLYEARSVEEIAQLAGRPPEQVNVALESARARLAAERSRRPRPALDDKVITSWNGLMISALARASQALHAPDYFDAAAQAAEFLLTRMYDGQTLRRRYREGEAAIPGFLDDYACLAQGLLDLYEAGRQPRHLEMALQLTEQQLARFEDRAQGGFFCAAPDPLLLLRFKDDYDGAEPSGNSVALWNLRRLSAISGRADLAEAAERTLAAFARQITLAPESLPLMLAALAQEPPRGV